MRESETCSSAAEHSNRAFLVVTSNMAVSDSLITTAKRLRDAVAELKFAPPVSHVYNPLIYAWRAHEIYLRRYGNGRKRVIFLGMNPGPFGMTQTGVPFGQIAAVRDWLGIQAKIARPPDEHPKRPVLGLDCTRSEISGQRLWGLFAKRFGTAEEFSQEHMVINYCPLAFCEESGRNRTPDKLPVHERTLLFAACDEHLREIVHILEPEWLVGVGDFAGKRAREVIADPPPRVGQILHPSPACPASNNNWAGIATVQLRDLGVWK
jgi:single-strand selective monofunctional uracil DNA glycosylase